MSQGVNEATSQFQCALSSSVKCGVRCIWAPKHSAKRIWKPLLCPSTASVRSHGFRPQPYGMDDFAWNGRLGCGHQAAKKFDGAFIIRTVWRCCLSPPGLCAPLTEVRWQNCQSHASRTRIPGVVASSPLVLPFLLVCTLTSVAVISTTLAITASVGRWGGVSSVEGAAALVH